MPINTSMMEMPDWLKVKDGPNYMIEGIRTAIALRQQDFQNKLQLQAMEAQAQRLALERDRFELFQKTTDASLEVEKMKLDEAKWDIEDRPEIARVTGAWAQGHYEVVPEGLKNARNYTNLMAQRAQIMAADTGIRQKVKFMDSFNTLDQDLRQQVLDAASYINYDHAKLNQPTETYVPEDIRLALADARSAQDARAEAQKVATYQQTTGTRYETARTIGKNDGWVSDSDGKVLGYRVQVGPQTFRFISKEEKLSKATNTFLDHAWEEVKLWSSEVSKMQSSYQSQTPEFKTANIKLKEAWDNYDRIKRDAWSEVVSQQQTGGGTTPYIDYDPKAASGSRVTVPKL